MSILGTRVARIEDPRFLTGQGTYIDNVALPGAVWLTYVRSTVAHGEITNIDISDAAVMPGVVAVWTAEELGMPLANPFHPMMNQEFKRPYLASGRVRYVGEPVAVVISETKAQGTDAAERVIVDYDTLPVVLDLDDAFTDRVLLHPEAGTNTIMTFDHGGTDDIFDGCDVVIELTIENQKVAPVPMEVRAAAATWDGTRLTQYTCSQGTHGARDGLAIALGLDPENVRSITPDVGGGFGAKNGIYPEEVMVGWIAMKLNRPVRWTETRSENMLTMGHGRGQRQRVKLGGTRDGRFTAYRLHVMQDSGAYGRIGAFLPIMTRLMLAGVYDIERLQFQSYSVVTNTAPLEAFRGAGRPEATAAIERIIDEYAVACGMDPGEVRRKNYIKPSAFPLETATGAKYDSGEYEKSLDMALSAAGYEQLRQEQRERRERGDVVQLGIGISTYVETTNPMGSGDYGAVEITADGGAIIRTGSSSHGQGHHTVWAMIVSEATGIPYDKIEFHFGDSDDIPRGGGTGGSRSLQVGGTAVKNAAEMVVSQALQRAADLLEAAVEDIQLDVVRGVFHVVGSPQPSKTWSDVVAADAQVLQAENDFTPEAPTFPFGSHVSVVEVDTETGSVAIRRHIACDDAGTIINPLIVDGQVHGGLAQGIAQALLEEVLFDEEGNPITSNLADYACISAAELPSFERIPMETPTHRNPLGAKGIGEAGTIGATPAVHNAVVDAIRHLGICHVDMPCTPHRVWNAIQTTR
jgi:carbon-monoxide dehydrogenase large subunit